MAFCGCFRHHFLTIDRDTDLKCDNAAITWTAHCFLSRFVMGSGKGLMRGEYDELGGASGAKGGDTGLVASIGVSFLTWGIGSPPMKS